jgi:hypothetical protein
MNCPHCQRVIYSRQHPRCGYCGADLPADLLLPAHEVDEMKAEMREIEVRRQEAKAKEEVEREATRRRNDQWQRGYFSGMQ